MDIQKTKIVSGILIHAMFLCGYSLLSVIGQNTQISLSFFNAEASQVTGSEQQEYLVYVDHTTKELLFKVEFDENAVLDVLGEEIKSGATVSLPLVTGVNKFALAFKQNGGEEQIYIIVHKEQDPDLIYHENYRPQLHFSSVSEMINDPNGLVYNASTGEYHLFYQTDPRTMYDMGNYKSWYQAVSRDLVHWEQRGPAIIPDDLGFCWSGSAVIDEKNTSGLFTEAVPPKSRMVALYTAVNGDMTYGDTKMCLAWSADDGKTWTKYTGNPVIASAENNRPTYASGFCDGKAIWYEDSDYPNGGLWLMVLGGKNAKLVSSENLIDWKFESYIKGEGREYMGGECPDFFPLELENEPGTVKWVFISGVFDLSTDCFQNIFAVGTLGKDSKGNVTYYPEQMPDKAYPLFYGASSYAAQSYYNDKNNRRVLISMARDAILTSNEGIDAKNWRGSMTWPVSISLAYEDGRYIVKSNPVSEMDMLKGEIIYSGQNKNLKDIENLTGKYYEIEAVLRQEDAARFGFSLREGAQYSTEVYYDAAEGCLVMDGTNGGKHAGKKTVVPISLKDDRIKLRIVVDTGLVEVFINDGTYTAYALTYPGPEDIGITCYTEGGDAFAESILITSLNSIWDESAAPPAEPDPVPMIIGAAAGVVLAGGGTAAWFVRKKKRQK